LALVSPVNKNTFNGLESHIEAADRFLKFVIKSDVRCITIPGLTKEKSYCWDWLGSTTRKDYGRFWYIDKAVRAHRFSYELYVGKIPYGLVIDHLCRNEWCVNPKHLEAVTSGENTRRGLSGFFARIRQIGKTHCPQKHPYSPENIYWTKEGFRNCKKCKRDYYQKKVVAKAREVLA